MNNYPFCEIEPNFLIENNFIISEEIDDDDSQISNSFDFRDIYSINNNFFFIIQPNILPLPSSNIINDNSNNNNIINKSKKEKEILILINNNNDSTISKTNNYLLNKKRPTHDKLAKDNIKRKINVFYSKFIWSLLNEIIKKLLNEKIQFFQLSHTFIKDVTHSAFNSLKNKTLGDIFKNNISPKYKKCKKYNNWKNLNIEVYNEVTSKSKIIKNILDKPYFEFFKYFLYHKTNVNLSKYGLNKDILLLNNNYFYEELKKKNETGDSIFDQKYLKKMDKIINKDFLSFFYPVFHLTN